MNKFQFAGLLLLVLAVSSCKESSTETPPTNDGFLRLTPPATGTGFQLHIDPFSIPAGGEREVFSYRPNPNSGPVYVNALEMSMRKGSHHFVLWTLNGVAEKVYDGAPRDRTDFEMNRGTRGFVFGEQVEHVRYDFPPGVALLLDPRMGFDLNSHYVNTGTSEIKGEAYLNIHTIPATAVQHVARPIFWVDQDFSIPPHSTYTRKTYIPGTSSPARLFLLTSHAHKRMKSFRIFRGDSTGQLLYESTNWHEPPVTKLDVSLDAYEDLYVETTWENESSKELHFGFTSEDEMNVVMGYYWKEIE